MIIDDLNLFRSAAFPHKAYPPPIVDSDAVLSFSVSVQDQPIAGRSRKIAELLGIVYLTQFSLSDALNIAG